MPDSDQDVMAPLLVALFILALFILVAILAVAALVKAARRKQLERLAGSAKPVRGAFPVIRSDE